MKSWLLVKLFSCLFILAVVSGCELSQPDAEPEPDPQTEPGYYGCGQNARGMSQTKKYATRQDIVQNMVKSPANIYGWTLKVPEACPVGKVGGTFSLGFEEGVDTLMTVTMTRIVVNVNGQDADYFVPEFENIPSLDYSGYTAVFQPENLCFGCDPEAVFNYEMRIEIVVDPSVPDPASFIANNIHEVYMTTGYTEPYN